MTDRILRRATLSALAFALVGMPAPSSAQDNNRSEDPDTVVYQIDPVVVTATRGPREVSAIPRPVSVVQRRDLMEKVPNSIGDLFRSLPGLDVTGVGPNQARPQIRGQRGQRILLLSDGMRLNNSRRQSDFGEIPALVDVNGVERVEVVRGPASVLYGSDAIGGVVNIINRIPSAEGLHGTASYKYGDVEGQDAFSARVLGRFGKIDLRAGGTVRNAGSYVAPAGSFGAITLADDTEVQGSGVQDQSFDIRVGYAATEQHSFFTKVEQYNSEDSGFGVVDPATYDPQGLAINITYPRQTYTKLSAGYLGQDLDLGIADRFELLTYAQDNQRGLNFGIGPFPIGPGMTLEMQDRNTTDIFSYGVRAEARKLATEGLLLTYGLDIWSDDARGSDIGKTIMTGFGPFPMVFWDNTPALPEAQYRSTGAFFQGEVEATEKFSIVAGARYQHVAAETFATAGLEDQAPVSVTDATVVAAANMLFQATENLSFVGSVGRAFRSPNLIERFYNGSTPEGSGFQVRNPELGPETSLNVDLGLRFRQGRVGFEAFAFNNTVYDGIRIQPLDYEVDGVAAYNNVNLDELVFTGIEIGGDVDLGSGLTLASNYSWMESKDALNENNPVGETFSSKMSTNLRYQTPGGGFWGAFELRHNGERKDVQLDNNPLGDVLPSFTVMHLRAGLRLWQTDSGVSNRLVVAVTNLTNQLYAEFSNASFFRPEPKRNVTVSWEVSF